MPAKEAFELGWQPCRDFKPQTGYWGHNEHECFAFGPKEKDPSASCDGRVSFCENCHRDHHSFGYERCGTPAAEDWAEYRAALAVEMPHLAPRPGDPIELVREKDELMSAVSDAQARGEIELMEHLTAEALSLDGGQ